MRVVGRAGRSLPGGHPTARRGPERQTASAGVERAGRSVERPYASVGGVLPARGMGRRCPWYAACDLARRGGARRRAAAGAGRLDWLPLGRFLRRVVVASGLGWAFDAMDAGLLSFAIVAIAKEWALTPGDPALGVRWRRAQPRQRGAERLAGH